MLYNNKFWLWSHSLGNFLASTIVDLWTTILRVCKIVYHYALLSHLSTKKLFFSPWRILAKFSHFHRHRRRRRTRFFRYILISETRCGEISPLWQDFKVFGLFLTIHLALGKILNLLCQIVYAIGQIFIAVNDLKIDQIIWPSGHTVILMHLFFIPMFSDSDFCSVKWW